MLITIKLIGPTSRFSLKIFSPRLERSQTFTKPKNISPKLSSKQHTNTFLQAESPRTYNALPTEAARLIDERDNLKKNNPADDRIPELNKNINKSIREHRKEKWQEYLSTCQPGSQKLWKTVKSLNDQPTQPDNQGIDFEDNKPTIDATKLANKFNQQYTPNIDKKPEQALRNTLWSMHSKPKEQPKIKFTPA